MLEYAHSLLRASNSFAELTPSVKYLGLAALLRCPAALPCAALCCPVLPCAALSYAPCPDGCQLMKPDTSRSQPAHTSAQPRRIQFRQL
ncbi:hypothetical protein ElyMa_001653800 [Elysia marginata]|uniref:FZ domain-containing protein n=1 Tax=Elysia marginata TaxID=1093978 RepID=A0AAV4JMM3_9GAST|nr:hypothetical protein ElyMa_001653800 [Elysia marginata]